ncbi:MAG: hypothetical protein ACNA7X_01215 [Dehalococcoidia bacterium]
MTAILPVILVAMYIAAIAAAYAGIIVALILILARAGVSKRLVLFAGFVVFGILSGVLAVLGVPGETALVMNPGVLWGEAVYIFSLRLIGDPHSAFAHYTIPWVLRTPQVFLLTSTAAWGLIGALAQTVYNRRKRPPVTKGLATRIMMLSLLGCLAVCTVVFYVMDKEHARSLEPSAVPVVRVGDPRVPEWGTITAYEVERLYLSHNTVLVGQHLYVTGWVKNTGASRGIVGVELRVDGRALSSQRTALSPSESKPVRFAVMVPAEGIYTVALDGLSADFTVNRPPKMVTEEESRQIAVRYLMSSPTFLFDGIEGNIRLISSRALGNDAARWEFVHEFECVHPGYGDRSGQTLPHVVTAHTARIVVRRGAVVAAVIDGTWDIMLQEWYGNDNAEVGPR